VKGLARALRSAALAALVLAAACTAMKPTTPEIQARQELMRSNKAALVELGRMTTGEAPWNQAAAIRHSTTLMNNAVMIPAKTEKGTGGESGRTRARPEIWPDWDKVQAASDTLEDEAKAVLDLAKANNEAGVRTRFASVEKACDSCHTRFMFPEFPR
jgi:cytochrome c556